MYEQCVYDNPQTLYRERYTNKILVAHISLACIASEKSAMLVRYADGFFRLNEAGPLNDTWKPGRIIGDINALPDNLITRR